MDRVRYWPNNVKALAHPRPHVNLSLPLFPDWGGGITFVLSLSVSLLVKVGGRFAMLVMHVCSANFKTTDS